MSEGPIVRRFFCPKVRFSEKEFFSEGSIVRRFDCPKVQSSKGSILRRFNCPKVRLSEGLIVRNSFFYTKVTLLLNILIKKGGVYGVYFFSVLKV